MRDDWALVGAAKSGDAAAFGELLQRHDHNMRGVAWRVVGTASAMDDVLQDAYLKAWRSIGDYRGDSAFSTWLYAIVHRCAIDHQRGQRRFQPARADVADAETVGGHVADHAGRIADSLALRDALADLPPDQLAVVALIDGEGRSYDEVAVLLDISPGTVGSRLHRARAGLRDLLERGDRS